MLKSKTFRVCFIMVIYNNFFISQTFLRFYLICGCREASVEESVETLLAPSSQLEPSEWDQLAQCLLPSLYDVWASASLTERGTLSQV